MTADADNATDDAPEAIEADAPEADEVEHDIHRLTLEGGRQVILIGTAHVSQESVQTVERTIAQESPDVVCVELDERRYNALRNKAWWESLNLFQVIRKGQAPFLLANLFLSSYQKRMGLATGVKPGAELAAAAKKAEELGAEVVLCDREIRTTLLRIWRTMPFTSKMGLASELLGGLLGVGEQQEISEEMLAELRKTDTLTLVLDEMGERHPTIKRTLVDERDTFMAHHIRTAPGERIVAVVGAAHVPGILKAIHRDTSQETIDEISTIPPRSLLSRVLPWLLPLIVIGLFVYGFMTGDTKEIGDAVLAWVLANGVLASLGALLAWGHPLTIITAFVAAPLTSLNPTVGAGMVTGLVQTAIAPPSVRDMEQLSDDLVEWKGWWGNRLTRILLVFFFSNIGSAIGTFVALGWLKNLL